MNPESPVIAELRALLDALCEESITPEQLERWRREGAVEVWGRRDDMPDILRGSSLVVLPTYYREGVPKILIEAAATGLPAVTTDAPGCRDIVVDGQTGLLVPPRDADALAEAIATLLRDPVRRTEMGKRAREHALSAFSLERVIAETLRIYGGLLS